MNGTAVIIAIVVIWFLIQNARINEQMKAGDESRRKAREEEENACKADPEHCKIDSYGMIRWHSGYEPGKPRINGLSEWDYKKKQEKEAAARAEKWKKEAEERKAAEERAAQELKRKAENRPTVKEMSKDNYNTVSEDDVDYIDITLYGNGGEFNAFYIKPEEYEMFRLQVEEDLNPDAEEDWEDTGINYEDVESFSNVVIDSDIMTHYTWITTCEIGTKKHFLKFDFEGDVKDDPYPMGKRIMDVLGLDGTENGYVGIQYTHSKKHYLSGAFGVDTAIRGPLTAEKFEFYNTTFKIGNREFNYDDIGFGEYADWWNSIYTAIVPVSELEDFDASDIW